MLKAWPKAWVIVLLTSTAWAADAAPDRVRDAATKAVALIQASQKDWYSKGLDCTSCHQQILPALAFRSAREHGIPVNEDAAHADAAMAFKPLADLDKAIQYTHIIDPALSDGYMLVAADAAGVRPNLVTAVYARLIAAYQKSDGQWLTVDQRPPQSRSTFTSTAIAMRAVQLYSHPSLAADTRRRVERARNWLGSKTPRNTEERAFQLFGLSWAGAAVASRQKLGQQLAAAQNADGGWNSLDGLPSDAYSTGEALVALHDGAGVETSDAAWQRGLQFLLSTQAADGSWHIASRVHPPAPVSPPYTLTGYPYGHDQFISAMGASWAIRALAEALGPARKVEMPKLAEAEPAGVEPWMETALFGTSSQLRQLLDKKFDPNSATKSGTTALMMAQPDLEKTRLLLDRGAKVDARSTKTNYSALLVASHYSGSEATLRLLLDRGAPITVTKGAAPALFNATPVNLAAFTGDLNMLGRLRTAGDDLNAVISLLGSFQTTPLMQAVGYGDAAETRFLLDAGAAVDKADGDGITPLGWAAIGNHPEVARALIEKGADVNHLDKKLMTPLLYAASIDYGDSEMVDLLLKAGANPRARTTEGMTAFDLARTYHHAHLLKSLDNASISANTRPAAGKGQ